MWNIQTNLTCKDINHAAGCWLWPNELFRSWSFVYQHVQNWLWHSCQRLIAPDLVPNRVGSDVPQNRLGWNITSAPRMLGVDVARACPWPRVTVFARTMCHSAAIRAMYEWGIQPANYERNVNCWDFLFLAGVSAAFRRWWTLCHNHALRVKFSLGPRWYQSPHHSRRLRHINVRVGVSKHQSKSHMRD